MRLVIAFILLVAWESSIAQSPSSGHRLSAAQQQTVQRCAYAASTAAEAFRQFPTDKNRRIEFVYNIAKRFEKGQGVDAKTAPSQYQMVLALISMEADQSLKLNISDKTDSDVLIARAAARCALSSNNRDGA